MATDVVYNTLHVAARLRFRLYWIKATLNQMFQPWMSRSLGLSIATSTKIDERASSVSHEYGTVVNRTWPESRTDKK